MRSRLRELAAYGVVGLSNTLVSALVYVGLRQAGAPSPAAGAVAFLAGAANGFVWNRRWTFRATQASRLRYVLVQAVGLGATTALLDLGTAYALTLCAVTGATYLLNRGWTFR